MVRGQQHQISLRLMTELKELLSDIVMCHLLVVIVFLYRVPCEQFLWMLS